MIKKTSFTSSKRIYCLLTALPDMPAISLSLLNTAGTVNFGGANIVLWELLLVYKRKKHCKSFNMTLYFCPKVILMFLCTS